MAGTVQRFISVLPMTAGKRLAYEEFISAFYSYYDEAVT
jgi:hypothetical protein